MGYMTNKKTDAATIAAEYMSMTALLALFGNQLTARTIQRWMKDEEKEFPRPLRFGRKPLFKIEEVRQWADSHRRD